MANILVYALHNDGQVNKNSRGAVSEAAALAGQLGGEAHAVLVGTDLTDALAAQLGSVGATKVWTVNAPEGVAAPAIDAISALVDAQGYDYVLFGGGLLGFEIGAGLAARIGGGVTVEVTKIAVTDGKLVAERPIFGDSLLSHSHYKTKGVIVARTNAFEVKETGGTATVEAFDAHQARPYEVAFLAEHVTRITGFDAHVLDVAGPQGLVDHVQHQQRLHAVVAEALPELGRR